MDPRTFLPLKHKVFMVLLALSGGPGHGYGIRKDVLDRSDGAVELDPGGLYRLIARLEADGLIRVATRRPPSQDDDERRNYYELTELGTAVLGAEARRLERLVGLPEVAAAARGTAS